MTGVRRGALPRAIRSSRHDVSILIGVGAGVGRYLGSQPGAKTSMTIMRPPQRGQGQGSPRGSSGVAAFFSSGPATRAQHRAARGPPDQHLGPPLSRG